MLISVVLVAIALVAALLVYSATKPGSFRIERTAVIKAPPKAVLGYLEDFHRWSEWSPWETLDADLKRSFEGPDSGEGAIYRWEGRRAGTGRMEIRRADTEKVLIQLDFIKPMKANNTAEFDLASADGGTRVVWGMNGRQPFMGKVMSNFFNMDKLVGAQFEDGLRNLKEKAEAKAVAKQALPVAGDPDATLR